MKSKKDNHCQANTPFRYQTKVSKIQQILNGNPKCEFPEYKAGAETTTCLCRSTDTVLPTYELALEARSFIYRDYKTL